MITQTLANMTRLPSSDQDAELTVTFVLDDDHGKVQRTLLLSYEDWVELGSPDELAVTATTPSPK